MTSRESQIKSFVEAEQTADAVCKTNYPELSFQQLRKQRTNVLWESSITLHLQKITQQRLLDHQAIRHILRIA